MKSPVHLAGSLLMTWGVVVATLIFSRAQAGPARRAGVVQVQMQNVIYHFTDPIAAHIKSLSGEIVPTAGNEIPVFDDKNSYTLSIAAAVISIETRSLANILNSFVFSGNDSPLKDISIDIDRSYLRVKGKLHHQADIGFETEGTLSTTPDGKIRLHADHVKASHLPVKGLMDLFGVKISDLIRTGKIQGIRVEKNDLILDLEQILPPPHIQGRVTQVKLEGQNVIQVFGTSARRQAMSLEEQNYMLYRGNRLKFGKLTMDGVDLALIDLDPQDPFDFYFDHYKDQLVAGYTKTTSDFGLRVFMRDFNKLGRPPRTQSSSP